MIYLKEGKTPLNFAYNDEIIQEGNSKYQLSFKFPTNNPLWEELVEETLLLADDLHGEQEFIVFEVEKHHAYITVYANQVATLLNNYSITELSVNNASGDRVMRSLVSSIIREHKFTFSSDIANTHSLNLKNVTVANALFKDKHSILGQWGGDLIRDKYDIRLLSNGGATKEALFMYKKNLKSYQQKKSIKDLRTRIHFTKTINSQKEGEKDKVIAVTVDSPLINKYKNIYEGNLDVSDQDVVDEATLRKYGEQYFKTTLCDVIEENIEISVLGTPDVPVQIFDTVTIFYEKYNLDVKKKITKYTYSPMGRRLKSIGFGKIQSNLGTTLASMVDNAIEEKAETMLDAFKIQKNLAQLLKLDRKGIEDKLVELEEKSKGALEVKKALFEADGTIPDVVKTKILDAVEGDIGRLKTIITEAELIKAIQAKLNFAEIKNALIDKAFINQIISDEKFTQQFEEGQVTTQNIFTKLKDSIKSNISKEFVTKDGVKKLVNDLTIDADGIRQITQQESQKVFNTSITGKVQEIVGEVKKNLPTKEELKGKSSYLHKKYSDYADGRNMSDNSTLKYIGLYTGDKQQAPTNASEYSWTKIRGEDGARGRDGERGRDGVDGKSYARNYLSGTADEKILTAVNDNFTTQEAFKLVDNKNFRDLGFSVGDKITFIADYEILPNGTNKKISGLNFEWYDDNRYRFWMNQDLNPTKGTFTRTITANNDLLDSKRAFLRTDNVNAKIKITNARVIKGDTVQPWSIAQEDLQGHSLTANVRMEGRYVNNITNNVKIFAEVYYDGQRVTNGYTLKIKHKGGNNTQWGAFYTRNYTENGEILQYDWGNKEQNGTPLEVIVLIDYKGMSTVATARMENIPDIVEIKEITKKYKTFESTIDRFNSTIGEVKQQVLANEEKRNLVLGSRMFNEKDYKLFGGSITRSVFQEYNGLPYMSMVSYEGNKHIWQGVGFNLSFSRIKKGERYSIRLPIRLSSALSLDLGAYVEIKNHLTRGILWNARLDVNNVQKDKWIEREFQFTADRDFDLGDGSFLIYIVRGGYINFAQPYMCEGDTLPKKYSPAPEDFYLQNSRIESSIIQTKEQIGLKVSKDEIISAINLSVEKDGNGQDAGLVKIDASRVDIRGALKAFQGDIGTFSIGGNKHTGYGKWITGVNQFQIGMSDGTNGALGTALWVNWGDKWDVEGKQSWYVMNNGAMIVNNRANINALYVTGDSYFARRLRAQGDGVDVGGSDVYGTASGIGTSVIWWSQIDDVKSSVSDERLKTNVNPTKVNALETLNNIEMVEFNWIKDGEFEKIGAIAQQVQSVEETLVVNDTSDKNNPSDYLRISYYNCIPYLIKAIQELSTENQQLKSQLQLMNERLTKLEEQLNGKL